MIWLKMARSSTQELGQALLTIASAIAQNVVASQARPCAQQSASLPDRTVVNNAPVVTLNVSVNSPAVSTHTTSSNRYLNLI